MNIVNSVTNTTAPPSPSHDGRVPLSVILLLAVTVSVVHGANINSDFAWIDRGEILEKTLIVDSAADLVRLLVDDSNHRMYYRPVNNLIHSFNWHLWHENAAGYHLFSVSLHTLNAILAMFVARAAGYSATSSAATALVWAVHPVTVESVALISVVQGLAVSGLLLATVLSFATARATSRHGLAWRVLAYMLFFVALFTKELAYVLPLVAIAARLDSIGEDIVSIRDITVLVVITAVAVVWRMLVTPFSAVAATIPAMERVLTFQSVFIEYIIHILYPVDLHLSDTVTRWGAFSPSTKLATFLGFGAIALIAVSVYRRHTRTRLAIIVFVATLAPVSQIVPLPHFRGDRYLYLPTLAAVFVIAELLRWYTRRLTHRRQLLGLVWVIITVALASETVRITPRFGSDSMLFSYEVNRTPDYREGLCMLGQMNDLQGKPGLAEQYYRGCIETNPDRLSYANIDRALVNLSANLISQGRHSEAGEIAKRGERATMPRHLQHELRYNRAVAHYNMMEFTQAIPLLLEYASAYPESGDVWRLIAISAQSSGNYELEVLARSRLEAATSPE